MKVLKLCLNKNKLRGDEKIIIGENVLAVLQRKLPRKTRNLGMFTKHCAIGNTRIEHTMLD